MNCSFRFSHYEEILRLLGEKGYAASFFMDFPSQSEKKVYVRHDIDLDLEKCVEIARREHEYGIVATYFLRLAAPYYNIFDYSSEKIVRQLLDWGHRLGLHFEVSNEGEFRESIEEVEREVLRQLSILKQRFPIDNVVSFHRCPQGVREKDFDNFVSTYAPSFFPDLPTKYLSDSRGTWREGCVCARLAQEGGALNSKNFQILTHPIWWGERDSDANRHLQRWLLLEKCRSLDNVLAKDIDVYQKRIFMP